MRTPIGRRSDAANRIVATTVRELVGIGDSHGAVVVSHSVV